MRRYAQRRGFTLIELLTVIAIIAMLAGMLMPVFARARESARQSTCGSNVKQWTTAMLTYTQDYDECFPQNWSGTGFNAIPWYVVLNPYVKNTGIRLCPSEAKPTMLYGQSAAYPCDYDINYRFFSTDFAVRSQAEFNDPSGALMLCHGGGPPTRGTHWLVVDYYGQPGTDIHNGGTVIGYVDGHAKWYKILGATGTAASPQMAKSLFTL